MTRVPSYDPSGEAPLAGFHFLVVGINYAPEHTGNAPYTTGTAEHLAARGARVTVFTGMPYYPAWEVAEEYRGRRRSRERLNGVDVRRFRQYVPQKQSAIRRGVFDLSFFAHALPFLRIPRPHAVIGVLPTLSDGLLAACAAARYGVPYGLVSHDLLGQAAGQYGVPGGKRVERAARSVEGWLARRGVGVVIDNEFSRPYFEGLGVEPGRIIHVKNWSHIGGPSRSREEMRAELGWSSETQIVLHAGNMGLKQGLENVVEAGKLAARMRPHLRFVFMGDGNQRAHLEALAAGCPAITFMEPQSEERFPNVLAAADVLLVNERPSFVDAALPSKTTSYFMAGRPTVAAVVPGGTTAREIERSGAGLVAPAGDPPALLDALDRLWAEPALAERLGAAGPGYAEQHLSAAASLGQLERFAVDVVYHAKPRTSARRAVQTPASGR